MKKLYYPIILIIIILIVLVVILIEKDIIIFKNGKIDNLKYTVIDEEFKVSSKIVDHYSEHDTSELTYQYPEITFHNFIYDAIFTSKINESYIENFLDTIHVTGLEEPYLTKVSTNASIYKIKNISEDVAIAIKFENTNRYYTYLKAYCKPSNLGELINMFNFDEYLCLDSISYTKNVYIKDFFEQNNNLKFSNLSEFEFKNIIFKSREVMLDYNTLTNLNQYFRFNTTSPIYGSFFSIVLTRDANMIISIPAIGNTFICNIGSDNYNSFLKFIEGEKAQAKIIRTIYM